MEGSHWVAENWFEILSAIGIVGGLFFTALALWSDNKTRKIGNLLTITRNHRDIWKEFSRRADLSRVRKPSVGLAKHPITPAEEEFVNFVILHLSSVYYATRDELVMKMDGMRRDVGQFFSLPIPRAVWEKAKFFHNDDFVSFVEGCLKGGASIKGGKRKNTSFMNVR